MERYKKCMINGEEMYYDSMADIYHFSQKERIKKQTRFPLMKICQDAGMTCDQYMIIKNHIANNYRRRIK